MRDILPLSRKEKLLKHKDLIGASVDFYTRYPFKLFMTPFFPRIVDFERARKELNRWMCNVQLSFKTSIGALGIIVKGADSMHTHILVLGGRKNEILNQISTSLFREAEKLWMPFGKQANCKIGWIMDKNDSAEYLSDPRNMKIETLDAYEYYSWGEKILKRSIRQNIAA